MKRRKLTILSIACLVVIGVLLLSFAGRFGLGISYISTSGGNSIGAGVSVNLRDGHMTVMASTYAGQALPRRGMNTSFRHQFGFRFFPRRWLTGFENTVVSKPPEKLWAIWFPSWCVILPCCVPLFFSWRRRRKDGTAMARGFGVEVNAADGESA